MGTNYNNIDECGDLFEHPCAWGDYVGSEASADPRILLVEN